MPSSDADLIESSWFDAEAFAGIFDRHFPAVYGFCARRVGTVNGEELAGETFLRAFGGRDRYDVTKASALPWLIGVARNVVREHLRRVRREGAANRRLFAGEPPATFDCDVFVAAARDASEQLKAIVEALPRLPEAEVDTLLLCAMDGLSYEECARVLAVPVGTVRSRLNRVRRRLRGVLTDASAPAGVSSWHDAALATQRPHPLGDTDDRSL